MEKDLLQKLEEQDKKIDLVYESVEKIRKYFLWTLIISIATVILPILGFIIMIPWLIKTLGTAYSGLGL